MPPKTKPKASKAVPKPLEAALILPGVLFMAAALAGAAVVTIGRRLRKLWPLWVVLAALLAVVLVLLLPPLLVAPYGLKDPEKRLAAENAMRTPLAATFGGLAVIAGTIVGALNFRETARQNRATSEQNRAVLELQRRGQVTERFGRAVEQLGEEKRDVRIGAIYALEQIALDSPELHWPIVETLTAFIREHSTGNVEAQPTNDLAEREQPNTARRKVAADIQAGLTVLGRRNSDRDQGPVDLMWADLQGAHLTEARLHHALFHNANLDGAGFLAANLQEAVFFSASLERTFLQEANLRGAHLTDATLQGADLTNANLEGADFIGVNLQGATLTGAKFRGAWFFGADLQGAKLTDADLKGADFSGANLQGAVGLTQEQLDSADYDEDTKPPSGLTIQLMADR